MQGPRDTGRRLCDDRGSIPVMQLQAKECQGLPTTSRCRETGMGSIAFGWCISILFSAPLILNKFLPILIQQMLLIHFISWILQWFSIYPWHHICKSEVCFLWENLKTKGQYLAYSRLTCGSKNVLHIGLKPVAWWFGRMYGQAASWPYICMVCSTQSGCIDMHTYIYI